MPHRTDKSVTIFVNGILTFPGAAENWNRRAVTHFISRFDRFAESLEYLTFAITRFLFVRYRANKLAKKLLWYQDHGFKIHLVGHSNGANVIFNALKWGFEGQDIRRVESIQLFSPACSEDADALGVNQLFKDGRLGRLRIYRAGGDVALMLASAVGRCVGYGALGLNGFGNVQPELELSGLVSEHHEPVYNHSTWFEPDNFDFVMTQVRNFIKGDEGQN